MSPSQKAVQGIHAAIESANAGYLKNHENVVFCCLKNSEELSKFSELLLANNIDHKSFVEPDLDNKLTAIATQTVYNSSRKLFSKLKLVK